MCLASTVPRCPAYIGTYAYVMLCYGYVGLGAVKGIFYPELGCVCVRVFLEASK